MDYRMVRGHAKDLVLPAAESDEFILLARRMGLTPDDWEAGVRNLKTDIEENMGRVRKFWEAVRKRGRGEGASEL